MANISRIDVPVAVNNHAHLDLSCDHVTTQQFMTLQPVYYRHMMKTEHLNVTANVAIRPAPMVVPVYGSIRACVRAFYVPYRLCFPQWHSFYDDNIGSNDSRSSLVDKPPYFESSSLYSLFTDSNYGLTNAGSSTDFDFEDSNSNYYIFTAKGRRFYKILLSLGYALIPSKLEFNMLGLLALCKIYVDWYAPSQYLDTANVLSIQQYLSYNDPTTPKNFTTAELFQIFDFVDNVRYRSNGYFEDAWDNPVAPTTSQSSSFTFFDVSTNSNSVTTLSDGTPVMQQSGPSVLNIGTQYVHDVLKKLTSYQRRHALSGARSIDRVLNQYGIQTDYLRQMRSIYVGCQIVDVDTGSVMATAAGSNGSQDSSVGDYAGAGFGKGSKTWDFTCDEEGIFMVLSSIIPSGGYFQGYDANNRMLDKTQFFVPELDSLGTQVVEKGECYVSNKSSFGTGYDGTFGWVGRYGHYKRPLNRVTGDLVTSIMNGGNSWHLMRVFNDDGWQNDVVNVSHSYSFLLGKDYNQYMRLFQYTKAVVDPFYSYYHFKVDSYAPCKSLFETYDFDEQGKKISTDVNGTTLN